MIARADNRKPLTPVQADVLEMIKVGCAIGRQPSLREMGAWLGIEGITVFGHIARLEKKGYVRRNPRQARCIEVIP